METLEGYFDVTIARAREIKMGSTGDMLLKLRVASATIEASVTLLPSTGAVLFVERRFGIVHSPSGAGMVDARRCASNLQYFASCILRCLRHGW